MVTQMAEFRRGWNSARAMWRAGFAPQDHLPALPPVGVDACETSFDLGWRRFCALAKKEPTRVHAKR